MILNRIFQAVIKVILEMDMLTLDMKKKKMKDMDVVVEELNVSKVDELRNFVFHQ